MEEMKKEKSPVSTVDKSKDLVSKLSRLSVDNNVFEGSTDLPQVFQVVISHRALMFENLQYTLYLLIDNALKLNRNAI